MARVTGIALIAAIASVFAGCSESRKAKSEVVVARSNAPSQWTNVKNLSREGDVYFAGQPTADQFGSAKEAGITTVVNLRSEKEVNALDFDEPALVRQLGMDYVSIPITPDTFGPGDADALARVMDQSKGPVVIHCASSNRVGALWAMYLHRHKGVNLDEAIARGKKAGLRSEALTKTVCEVGE